MFYSRVEFLNKLNLPSLPVPTLNQTLTKYLKSAEPFLNAQELENTKKIIEKFEDNEGPTLQNYLENKAENCENWLSDWWDNLAYLDCRYSLPVLSSPCLVFPLQEFQNETERFKYAAKLILGAIDHKLKIDNELLPQEKLGEDLIDMNQYKKIYGGCRIPKPKRDKMKFNKDARHIIVALNDRFFKMEVITVDKRIASFNRIVDALQSIRGMSHNRTLIHRYGILTSDNRDNWCRAYEILGIDPINIPFLESIEESLFLLCLDTPLMNWNDDTLTSAVKQCLHGGGFLSSTSNRWFDKTLQFIVCSDGKVGLIYEHAACDGSTIAALADHILDYIEREPWKYLPDVKPRSVKRICFSHIEELDRFVYHAESNSKNLTEILDLSVLHLKKYGTDFVKSHNLCPDGFIQMAIQYAFYRFHKVPGSHYESASTKKYIHGRTETIRSCSVEAIAFVKRMLDEDSSDIEKIEALKTAIDAHTIYANDARNGFGVDRHLLGLKVAAEELKMIQPEFFTDVAYLRSSKMRLYTSQVATRHQTVMVCKPRATNGYACCYNPRPDDILIGISAFANNEESDSTMFTNYLRMSLTDMHGLLVRNAECKATIRT